MDNRKIFLSNTDPDEALAKLLANIVIQPALENIPVIESFGRVSAQPVYAVQSSPNYNASAMDGIAVVAQNTFGADETTPVTLTHGVDFMDVDTGDVIKEPYNAVIMIEDIQRLNESTVEIMHAASPWQHVRPMGEDIVAHEMIIPSHHTIAAVDIGALLAGGVTHIPVFRKPRVGLLPTGTEIVEPGQPQAEGGIIESNTRVFENLANQYGAQTKRYPIMRDSFVDLKAAVSQLVAENDIVIVNAGSSAGTEDFTAPLIEDLGELLVHGIATRPGKPTALGVVDGKPVIGIPGYPVAAFFAFETFAKPLIAAFLGQQAPQREKIDAVASKRIVSSLKHTEFVPVKLGLVDGKRIATPINRGAGVTMSLVRADGLLVIPRNSEGCEAGETVDIELLRNINRIANTLVSIGSHDLIIDLIGSFLQEEGKFFLSSSHVGSMGGLMALKRGEAHVAPIHLLDEATGAYNASFVKRYLPDRDMAIIRGVQRVQGFIVAKGNPKNINQFNDLQRKDVTFVNRQRGAGTRLLLDYELKRRQINTDSVMGYDREMGTHMAVAAAVLSGSADVGLGVYSAAHALGLDFIPVGLESYDFALPQNLLREPMVEAFIAQLKSDRFAQELAVTGGYEMESTGDVVLV